MKIHMSASAILVSALLAATVTAQTKKNAPRNELEHRVDNVQEHQLDARTAHRATRRNEQEHRLDNVQEHKLDEQVARRTTRRNEQEHRLDNVQEHKLDEKVARRTTRRNEQEHRLDNVQEHKLDEQVARRQQYRYDLSDDILDVVDVGQIYRDQALLKMEIEDDTILVTGGFPGTTVALIIGLQRASLRIGGAHIQMIPLAVLAQGQFDAQGQFRWQLEAPLEVGLVPTVVVQAVTDNELGGFLATGSWSLSYGGGTSINGAKLPDPDSDR